MEERSSHARRPPRQRLPGGFERSERPRPSELAGMFLKLRSLTLQVVTCLKAAQLADAWLGKRMDAPGVCSVSVSVSARVSFAWGPGED